MKLYIKLHSILQEPKKSPFKTRLVWQYFMLQRIREWNRAGGVEFYVEPSSDINDAEYVRLIRNLQKSYRRSHRRHMRLTRIGFFDAVKMIWKAGEGDTWDFEERTAYDKWTFIQDERILRVREYVMTHSQTGGVHGIEHWDRVYANGQLLITRKVNRLVVGLFAYLHDYCRMDDGTDLGHGPRAAEFIDTVRDTLLKDVCDEDLRLLKEACRLHTVVHKTGNATIDACFDADRLDLRRVGIVPDPAMLATKKGKELAWLRAEYD